MQIIKQKILEIAFSLPEKFKEGGSGILDDLMDDFNTDWDSFGDDHKIKMHVDFKKSLFCFNIPLQTQIWEPESPLHKKLFKGNIKAEMLDVEMTVHSALDYVFKRNGFGPVVYCREKSEVRPEPKQKEEYTHSIELNFLAPPNFNYNSDLDCFVADALNKWDCHSESRKRNLEISSTCTPSRVCLGILTTEKGFDNDKQLVCFVLSELLEGFQLASFEVFDERVPCEESEKLKELASEITEEEVAFSGLSKIIGAFKVVPAQEKGPETISRKVHRTYWDDVISESQSIHISNMITQQSFYEKVPLNQAVAHVTESVEMLLLKMLNNGEIKALPKYNVLVDSFNHSVLLNPEYRPKGLEFRNTIINGGA